MAKFMIAESGYIEGIVKRFKRGEIYEVNDAKELQIIREMKICVELPEPKPESEPEPEPQEQKQVESAPEDDHPVERGRAKPFQIKERKGSEK